MELTDFSPELNVYLVPFHEGKILILKRKSGFWEFPGGGVEFGEHPEKAAARETMEETGLEASGLVLLGITSATYPKDGKEKHSVYIVYSGQAKSGSFTLSGEHEDGRWINLSELEFVKLALNAQDVAAMLRK